MAMVVCIRSKPDNRLAQWGRAPQFPHLAKEWFAVFHNSTSPARLVMVSGEPAPMCIWRMLRGLSELQKKIKIKIKRTERRDGIWG